MPISAEISNSWPSAGAGVNSQGVTSSVGPVAVERGYTGTDSWSKLDKGRLEGERGGEDDCLRETGDAGVRSDREGPGDNSHGVTSSTGPVFVVRGAEICVVEIDEDDLRFFWEFEVVETLKSLYTGNAGTGYSSQGATSSTGPVRINKPKDDVRDLMDGVSLDSFRDGSSQEETVALAVDGRLLLGLRGGSSAEVRVGGRSETV